MGLPISGAPINPLTHKLKHTLIGVPSLIAYYVRNRTKLVLWVSLKRITICCNFKEAKEKQNTIVYRCIFNTCFVE
jgi:hypothetical protein